MNWYPVELGILDESEYFFQPKASNSPSDPSGLWIQKLNCRDVGIPSNETCTGQFDPPVGVLLLSVLFCELLAAL